MVKVYKSETVISVTDIEAPSGEKALKYARAVEGMPGQPAYTEVERRGFRMSLSPDIGKREVKAQHGADQADAPEQTRRAVPAAVVGPKPVPKADAKK